MKTSSAASILVLVLSLAASGCSASHETAANHGSSSEGVPKAPTDLKVVEAAGGAHLTWKDNADNESEFMIERKQGAASFVVLENVAANKTDYHDATVMAGLSYTYRIMAIGKGGHAQGSGYSNEVVFTAPGGATPAAEAGATPEAGGADAGAVSDAGSGRDAASDVGGRDATDAADARDPHMGHM